MESYEVLRQVFKPAGCKRVAQELQLSVTLIHKWSRGKHGKSEAANPLDRLLALLRFTGDDRLLDWLCAVAGGEFVRSGKLPGRACRCWEQFKAEMEQLLKAAGESRPAARNFGPKEGHRCPHRRPGGRCGFPARKV